MKYPETLEINGTTWRIEKWSDLLQYHFHDKSYSEAIAGRLINRIYPKQHIIAVDDHDKDGELFRWKQLVTEASEYSDG